MSRRAASLPKHIPEGTKYVVEGRSQADGMFHVSARYLVLPDGQRINLPARDIKFSGPAEPSRARRQRRRISVAPHHAGSGASRRRAA